MKIITATNKNKMKILAIGDVHIKTTNFTEINMFFSKLQELLEKQTFELIVVLGDVLDQHEIIHSSALNKAYELINICRKHAKTFVLVGNHDMENQTFFLSDKHWMNGMKEWENVYIVDTPFYYEAENIIFCPYVSNGKFVEALSTLKSAEQALHWKSASLIFAHQEFRTCKMGAIVSKDGDEWDEEWPFVISGHIHKKQWVGKNVFYTGSVLQNAFGESEKNIVAIIDYSRNNRIHSIEEVDFELPRKKIIYSDIDGLDNVTIKDGDKTRITVKGDYHEFKALKKSKKYKELVEKGVKVVFREREQDVITTFSDTPEELDIRHLLRSIIEQDVHSEQMLEIYEEIFLK